ncbi:MAG: ATP-binding protein [Leptolyngbyaceae cyanobacterium]
MNDNAGSINTLQEAERLAVLDATALLDSPPEEAFDQFTRMASTILETPVSLISLVDRDRQFFKSCLGLLDPWASARETPLSHSFCQHVVRTEEVLAIADARQHPLLQNNLAVTELNVIAYLGIPLRTSQGYTLGSLCVIDSVPRYWAKRDITILQHLAQLTIEKIELRALASQFQSDYLRLRGLELHRDEMAAMLVHDLRNPLSSLITGLQLAQRDANLAQKSQSMLQISLESAQQLLTLVNNILEINRLEEEQLALHLTTVRSDRVIANACKTMELLATQRRVSLSMTADQALSHEADEEKLQRLLVNLIANSIQHTPEGGQVSVEAQAVAAGIQYAVTDTGKGIPADAYELIFQKFGRIAQQRSSDESLGLGLTFSRIVVEAHGGQIWVESKLGQGSQFYVVMPLNVASVTS